MSFSGATISNPNANLLTRAQAGAFVQAPVAPQEWMAPPVAASALLAVTADLLYAAPWIAPQSCDVDQIAVLASTGAVGNLKLGLADAAGNLPGATLRENTADLSTAGGGLLIGSFAAQPVVAGRLYYILMCFSGTPTMRSYANSTPQGGGYFFPIGSLRNTPNALLQGGTFYVSRALTYVPGPTPFFPVTFGAPTLTTSVCPIFTVRRA